MGVTGGNAGAAALKSEREVNMLQRQIDATIDSLRRLFSRQLKAQVAAFKRMPFTGIVALAALLIGAFGWTHAYLESASRDTSRALPSQRAAYEQVIASRDAASSQAEELCPEILHFCRS